jgi:RNA polymerase sigma factor (sigma-70 family)
VAPADRDQDDDDPNGPLALAGFERFFRENFQRLVNYVKVQGGRTVSAAEAKEIAQDVMMGLYQRLEKLAGDPIDKPIPYIYKSARNGVYRHGKADRAQKHALCALDLSRVCCDGDPETAYLAEEGLQRMLRELTRAQREVMELYAQGLVPKDIAPILEKTPAAIRQLKTNALERLRETHAAWEDRPDPPETGKEDA